MSLEKAREHLELAKKQWNRACTDSWEPTEPASCVTNSFYAYENLIVAAAEADSRKWAKNHYKKAGLATQLVKDGLLKTDLSEVVLRLNDLRKDVSYGQPGLELEDADLEGFVTDLEYAIDEVEDLLNCLELEAIEGEGQ